MQSQCHVCWDMLSEKSQKHFTDWIIKDIYAKKPVAAKEAGLGPKEIHLMLRNNDSSLMKTFWRHFYISSRAYDFVHYARYSLAEENAQHAVVKVQFQYPNGRQTEVNVTMQKHKGAWRFAYMESKLPF
jgi:hypothetical protein